MLIKAGAASQTVMVRAFDASTGLPYTTPAFGDAGISLWYKRGPVGAKTAITPLTQTDTGAYSSGGFVHIGDGICRLDLPDAALLAGVDFVQIGGSATAWTLVAPTVRLVGYDPRVDLTTAVLAYLDAAVSSRSTLAAGAQMDLVDAPNATAVTAIQNGLATTADVNVVVGYPALGLEPSVDGLTLNVYRATTWERTVTGLGDISDRLALYITAKRREGDTDLQAVLDIKEAWDGAISTTTLLRVGGAAPALGANAKITVVDGATDAQVTFRVEAAETDIPSVDGLIFSIKVVRDTNPDDVDPLAVGVLNVKPLAGRAVS